MPNTTIRKADGTSGGSVVLSDKIFGAKITKGLLHQAVITEMTNSRQDTRNTKTRADVAGGGRKPYRQKGTGRARQGSISAPHYRHGGIVFGPHPRDLSSKMSKKARRHALLSALSVKAESDAIMVIDSIGFDAISTKSAAAVLANLELTGKVLFIVSDNDPIVYKSFRNIPKITTRVAPAFSVRDILDADTIVIVQSALETLENIWGTSGKTEEVAA